MEKQTVPHKRTAYKLSFEWSHTRVLFTYIKVRNTIIDLMLASGSERINIACYNIMSGQFFSMTILYLTYVIHPDKLG